jgi:hypothetical protein
MLDGDSDDTVSDQDLDMPDNPHREISSNTRRIMDQQFVCPHTPVSARTSWVWRTPLTMFCND